MGFGNPMGGNYAIHQVIFSRQPLRTALVDYQPERISSGDAACLLTGFAAIEKLAAGGKLLSARRVESSNVWRRQGHRSAAAHVAEATGSGLGPAINALKAARCLGLSLIHISEPTRRTPISYAVFCLKTKKASKHPACVVTRSRW